MMIPNCKVSMTTLVSLPIFLLVLLLRKIFYTTEVQYKALIDLKSVLWYYILGSHSFLLASIDIFSGKLNWQTKLGGRIESSACLTPCGRFAVVGCYDRCVYIVKTSDGAVSALWFPGRQNILLWHGRASVDKFTYLFCLNWRVFFCS